MIYGRGQILRGDLRPGRTVVADPSQRIPANDWRCLDPDRRIALIEQGLGGATIAAA